MELVCIDVLEDAVNDICFDYHGKRFATCSMDKRIVVWDAINSASHEKTPWVKSCDIQRAHNDSIWRLSWAHPEFGQIIASCSEDGTVNVWEEQERVTTATKGEAWQRKAQISDSKKSVNDVKFSPRQHGLKLATASADGKIRIYEATDCFVISHWNLQEEFQVEQTVGMDLDSEHGLTCLSWNDCPFEVPKMVVGGYSSKVVIWTCDSGSKWREELVLEKHGGVIRDVAWAPTMGRSFHLIATCNRTPIVKVYKILSKEGGALEYASHEELKAASDVWRIAWNVTGTSLVTSSDDGSVCLWKKNFEGAWVPIQTVPSKKDVKVKFYGVN